LATAAALPALAIPATGQAVAGNLDAALFEALAEVERLGAEDARLYAIRNAIGDQIDADLGPRPVDDAKRALSEPDLSFEEREKIIGAGIQARHAYSRRRQMHPNHEAELRAEEAYGAVLAERFAAEERFRRMPAATVAGVLAKLRN